MAHCEFCNKEIPANSEVICTVCGKSSCDTCPIACCDEGMDNALDAWLTGLAEQQTERLN